MCEQSELRVLQRLFGSVQQHKKREWTETSRKKNKQDEYV